MNTQELIAKAQYLMVRLDRYAGGQQTTGGDPGRAAKAQVCEFFRHYAGPRSSFLREAEAAEGFGWYVVSTLKAILQSFTEYLEAGLKTGMSPERRAQIDVISDFLAQADSLLEGDYHPAAAAMLIGASLEEFLRNWVEAEDLSIGDARPGIDAYAKALRAKEFLSKQDIKDITSWAGNRNHAAHGEWEEVSDRERVRSMLQSVNLFMRQKEDRGFAPAT